MNCSDARIRKETKIKSCSSNKKKEKEKKKKRKLENSHVSPYIKIPLHFFFFFYLVIREREEGACTRHQAFTSVNTRVRRGNHRSTSAREERYYSSLAPGPAITMRDFHLPA